MTGEPLPAGWIVRAYRTARTHRDGHEIVRWSYAVVRPGEWEAWTSPYRYGSEASAIAAGEADAIALEALTRP